METSPNAWAVLLNRHLNKRVNVYVQGGKYEATICGQMTRQGLTYSVCASGGNADITFRATDVKVAIPSPLRKILCIKIKP